MTYDLTNLTNTTGIASKVLFANQVSDGFIFIGLILAIFLVVLLSLKRYEFDKAFFVASFVSFVIAAFASYGGFINIIWTFVFLILTALSAIYDFAVNK